MRKWIVSIALLFMAGCGLLSSQSISEDNPLGFVDPNKGTAIFETGQGIAKTGGTIGAATGNPVLIGGSILAGAIITILGGSYLKRKK
ncbi:hypothetical protein LCGC14_0553800 [marine sediment metagenome]|uniref:PDGLE domain-containing protein n=1 Tax=marine sediment metagenome TaxID=412755 RepID=A0A0F9RP63_9ZZZZ